VNECLGLNSTADSEALSVQGQSLRFLLHSSCRSLRQGLGVDVLPDFCQFAISNGDVEDPIVLERPGGGLDLHSSDSNGQNPASLRAIIPLGRNHTITNQLLLLLEHILKDQVPPGASACVHKPSALVQLA